MVKEVEAPAGTCLVLSSLHPLKEWSLQEIRGGSNTGHFIIFLVLAVLPTESLQHFVYHLGAPRESPPPGDLS